MWIEPEQLRARLEPHSAELRTLGVRRLSAAGSRVREDWRPDSDLDLLVEFVPKAGVGLVAFQRLRDRLSGILGVPVDLIDRRSLRPSLMRSIEEDERLIFEAA
jgi:hypothetical protein